LKTKTDVLKNILAVCLSFVILYPVAWYFGMVKPSFIIAFTGLVLKYTGGGVVSESPLRFAVAGAFAVTGVGFLSVLVPITVIPVMILVLSLLGILVLVDYKTPAEFEWYSRSILFFIIIVCILRPRAWGVNELYYGAVLQALRLPDWTSRMMGLVDEILKFCGLENGKINRSIKGE
jgi:hypothetical protein